MKQVKNGYKNTEVGLIPEDWLIGNLGELCSKVTDGTHDTPKPTNTGVPFITAIHVKENYIHFENCYFLPKEVHSEIYKRCNPEMNDVLMVNIGAGVGTTAVVNVSYEFSLKNVALLKCSSKLTGRYLNNTIVYKKNKILNDFIAGGAQPFLSLGQISKIKIPLPPTLTEQKSIATALSDVDELITKLEKLIEKKKAIKQGAMQQLLTPPHKGGKRLEGFSGEWVETTLGESIKLQGGYAFSSNSFVNDGTPILRISNIQDNLIDLNEVVFSKELTIPKDFIVAKGDVLIAMSGATTGKIGIYKFNYNSFINQRVGKFRVKDNKLIDLNFISHLVRSKKFQIELTKQIAQGAQPNISGNQIESIVLPIPKDINEQIEIGKILSDIDNSIQHLEFKREKQVEIKQGMMQELLTGKTRLV